MDAYACPEKDSRNHLDAFFEEQMVVREAYDFALKTKMQENKRLVKGKKKGEGEKAEENFSFTGISAGEQRRQLEYEESVRLGRKREMIPMATAVRRPPEETRCGGMNYEYRFLGSKLDLFDGLSCDPQTTRLLGTKAQKGSPATRVRWSKAWMKQLVDEMDASTAPPSETQQEAVQEQSAPSESTRGRSPSQRDKCAKRKWSVRDPSRGRGPNSSKRLRRCRSSSADSSTSSSACDVSSISSDASRSPLHDVFSDDEAAIYSSSSSSDSDCSKEEEQRSAPTWDAFERYPDILEPENWQKEEEPLGLDA